MSIVIFGDLFTFPEGSAATNRVYTYAKGFLENVINVYVICFDNNYLDEKRGSFLGIKYYYPFSPRKKSKHFVARNWQKLVKYPATYSLIRKINKADKITAINSWSNSLVTHLFGRLLSAVARAKFIVECSEHPLRYYQSSLLKKKLGEISFSIESSISDGVFCISQYLMDFYKNRGVNGKKLLLVPSTVDPARFAKPAKKPVDFNYIGYFGGLTFKRDNVDLLIRAFADFSKQHPDIHLILGGYCKADVRRDILNLVAELNLQSRVTVLDYLKREEVVQYVCHAEILVMVRSNDLQSQASFPSKLTEFLATSRPVISVNVGEIPMYLKNGEHVFLVEPGNCKALAQTLDYVYRNPEVSQKVGQNGHSLTQTIFNYKYQATRMIGFISSLEDAR